VGLDGTSDYGEDACDVISGMQRCQRCAANQRRGEAEMAAATFLRRVVVC
jgi:hypothetical protein